MGLDILYRGCVYIFLSPIHRVCDCMLDNTEPRSNRENLSNFVFHYTGREAELISS